MIQAPLLGGMVDTAILRGGVIELGVAFRLILMGAFVGNILALFAAPTFARLFTAAIEEFHAVGSVPRVILKALHWRSWPTIARAVHPPRMGLLRSIRLDRLPRTFLILNVVMVSIYAIGVLASLYAGAQIPEYRATAIQLSAIVNGVATILLAIMVDPSAARVTDEAISGSRSEEDVMSMVFFLITGRLVATLVLAQLLLMPATEYIKGATLLLRHWFVGS